MTLIWQTQDDGLRGSDTVGFSFNLDVTVSTAYMRKLYKTIYRLLVSEYVGGRVGGCSLSRLVRYTLSDGIDVDHTQRCNHD